MMMMNMDKTKGWIKGEGKGVMVSGKDDFFQEFFGLSALAPSDLLLVYSFLFFFSHLGNMFAQR